MMFVAILGTTITPYIFFWQTSQEAEESKIREIGEDDKSGYRLFINKEYYCSGFVRNK
jgi:hypothetical protein